MEKGLETAISVENGLLGGSRPWMGERASPRQTWIKQAYGGALTCEKAYEGAITLRIQGLNRKTIICRGNNQRQQGLSRPIGSGPMPTRLVGSFRVTERYWRVKTLTNVQ